MAQKRVITMRTENSLPGSNRSFAVLTLGCKVNTYESDLIAQQMREAGFAEKNFEDSCDVYIVNTCTVTNIADRKSRKMLHRARKRNPDALIIAAGCYADAVMQGKGLPDAGVDLWVLNQDKKRLTELCLTFLEKKMDGEEGQLSGESRSAGESGFLKENQAGPSEADASADASADVPADASADNRAFLTRLDGHTRAFIKVEDGCNLFCSYCIIPYVRGRVRSRAARDTVKEVQLLSDGGVTEVVLTGIHLSSMGDQLLETIEAVEKVPGILRIRLGSLEPRWITKEVVQRLKACSKLCPHFHLSLQSGSDAVLKRMNRHYTSGEFYDIVCLLRETFPQAAITTDIITGFPGETEEEFQETLEFARKIRFYEAHVFPYSRRKGTVADRMMGQVEERIKAERSARLIAEAAQMSTAYRQQFLGQQQEFLAEEAVTIEGQQYLTGYTRQYVRCMQPWQKTETPVPAGSLCSGYAMELENHPAVGEYLYLN